LLALELLAEMCETRAQHPVCARDCVVPAVEEQGDELALQQDRGLAGPVAEHALGCEAVALVVHPERGDVRPDERPCALADQARELVAVELRARVDQLEDTGDERSRSGSPLPSNPVPSIGREAAAGDHPKRGLWRASEAGHGP
jgi:hypothetical protein